MKSISLKLKKELLLETDALLEQLDKSRNKYINEALDFYNQYQKRKLIAAQLEKESALISEDSMQVLKEFEALEDEI
jgi:metal-responsive CopG/Arc/MetJ family transcriptional regulator